MSLFRRIRADKLNNLSSKRGRGDLGRRRFKSRAMRYETLETRRLLAAEGAVHSIAGTFDAAGVVGDVAAEVRWGDGTTTAASNTAVNSSSSLQIRFDYSLDSGGFFSGANEYRRTVLQTAADSLVSRFSDDLAAIIPSGYNQWTPSVFHPSQGPADELSGTVTPLAANLPVAANEIIIYAGARSLPGTNRGVGGQASYAFPNQEISCPTQAECDEILAGINAFQNIVRGRGEPGALTSPQTDVAPSIGSVSFDSDTDWHFGLTTAGIQPGQADFLTVAVHEVAHVLGFGSTRPSEITSWEYLTSTGVFTGTNATAIYQGTGNVPVLDNHWAPSVQDSVGQATLMAAEIFTGMRQLFSPLDFAAMDDLGWDVVGTQTTVSAEHRYADNGVYPVEVILNGSIAGQLVHVLSNATIENVAPMLTVVGTQSATTGQTFNITNIGEVTDPGFANSLGNPASVETFDYTINWGDGSEIGGTATIDSYGNANGTLTRASFDAAHTYGSAGVMTVTVVVTDDDGGSAEQTFVVNVGESSGLTLELASTSISEGDGENATVVTIRRSGPATGVEQIVSLYSSDTSEATVPATAVIPGNATFTTVPVQAIDDALLDGDVSIELSASANGLDPVAVDLVVSDLETLTASFDLSEIREDAVNPVNLTVRRSNTDVSQELVVNVSGGNSNELNVPATIAIPAGQQETSVPVAPVNEDDPEPTMTLSFSFSAAAYVSGSAQIDLNDDEPPLFQNSVSHHDVNNSGEVTASDALRVINQLSARGGGTPLDPETEQPDGVFYDVNGDYWLTALDALVIINELIAQPNSAPEPEFVGQWIGITSLEDNRDEDRQLRIWK